MSLESIYREAGRELRSMLLGIDVSSFNAEKAEKIRRKTRAIVTALNVLVVQWARTAIPKEVRKASRRTRTMLEILGKKPQRPEITAPGYEVEEQVIEVCFNANRSIKETVDKYLSVALVASHKLRTAQIQEFSYQEASGDLNKIALEALAMEKSRGWLSKQMSGYLRTNLIAKDEFINIKGRMYRLSKYSQLVARTELRNAQSRATLDLCKQYDNDLVQISAHGTDCRNLICQPYEGNVYSISGRHTRYPILSDSPPYHPNCMHSILPTSEEAIKARGQRGPVEPTRAVRRAPVKPKPAKVVKRATTKWKPARTLKEAEAWANKNVVKKGGQVNYSVLSLENANVVNKELFELIKAHKIRPDYVGSTPGWKTFLAERAERLVRVRGMSGRIWASASYARLGGKSYNGMLFNGGYFRKAMESKLKFSLARSRTTGWHKLENVAHVVHHEYAHILDRAISGISRSTQFKDFYNFIGTDGGEILRASNPALFHVNLKTYISGYGATGGTTEAWAELFANYKGGYYAISKGRAVVPEYSGFMPGTPSLKVIKHINETMEKMLGELVKIAGEME